MEGASQVQGERRRLARRFFLAGDKSGVSEKKVFASRSSLRAAIFFCRSFGKEAITSSTAIIPPIVLG
jgi:hypothetical protein